MNSETATLLPFGLFRYLYNHYQVRYPDYYMFVEPMLPRDAVDAVGKIENKDLETHLATNSWLIGIGRPDLTESVQALWGTMTPRTRGDYLAGLTERTYFGFSQLESRLSSIREKLRDTTAIELTAETACEIGCCLLAIKEEGAFADLLKADLNWEQEIDRASPQDAKRWKRLDRLSRRVIDVFLEAALILNRPHAAKLILENGANPNILIWKLERSSNALYPALSYAIDNDLSGAIDTLLKYGADPRGSESASMRSPLAQAFQKPDFQLIKRLLEAGASLEDGPQYTEAPLFYCKGSPIAWAKEQLSELLGLLPIEAKPIFHSPHAQGGYYYTLLELVWDEPEKLAFAEGIGMDLRLTEYEMARIIQRGKYTTFCALVGRLGEAVMNQALERVQQKWPDFNEKS